MHKHPTVVLASRHHNRSTFASKTLVLAATGKWSWCGTRMTVLTYRQQARLLKTCQYSIQESKDRIGQDRRFKLDYSQLDASPIGSVDAWVAIDWVKSRSTHSSWLNVQSGQHKHSQAQDTLELQTLCGCCECCCRKKGVAEKAA